MAFSDIVSGKYKMAHRGAVPKSKLGAVADALKMGKKERDELMKSGKVYIIHTAGKKGPKRGSTGG
jgi:hypothetical protein